MPCGPSKIEIIRPFTPHPLRVVLFDFDGTLSLIREGWQEIMISFMLETLAPLDSEESLDELRSLVSRQVARLTGKQTIYQMLLLVEEVRQRGGLPEEALTYKRRYHERLWHRIRDRIQALREGQANPQDWLVTGSIPILENLAQRGLPLYLASGTDEVFVKEEARLLGLDRFFGGRIYGAVDEHQRFSKAGLVVQILKEQSVEGEALLTFGDGYVEIENTRRVGGVAVGVASREAERQGVDEWKRQRLIEAGADIVVPDFTEQQHLVACLMGESAT